MWPLINIQSTNNIKFLPNDILISRYMRRLYGQGMTTTSGGNISIRAGEDEVWISPSGIDKGDLNPSQIAKINLNGESLNGNLPSSEAPFHLEIYKRRSDIKSVLHAHSTGLVTLSVIKNRLNVNILPSVYRVCSEVSFIPYALPGSGELAYNIGDAFSSGVNAGIMENHGTVVGAESIHEAFNIFETIETAALISCKAATLGSINYLSEEQLVQSNQGRKYYNNSNRIYVPTDDEKKIRLSISKFVLRAYNQSLFISSMGSISCRFKNGFLITPHGVDRSFVTPDSIVYIDEEECFGDNKSSYSSSLHSAIYKARSEINSVVLAQPPSLMAFGVTGKTINTRTSPECYVLLRDIETIPFGEQYTVPHVIAERITPNSPLVLIQNDCIISTGTSLLEAFDRLEVAEFNAKFEISSIPFGGVSGLGISQQDELRKRYF